VEALKRALADIAIETGVPIGTAPIWRERVGEGVEESTGLGERGFDGDGGDSDSHAASFGCRTKSNYHRAYFRN
jgi:hypothetical protein